MFSTSIWENICIATNGSTVTTLLNEVFSDAKLSPLGSNQRHHENDPFATGEIMSQMWKARENCLIECMLE